MSIASAVQHDADTEGRCRGQRQLPTGNTSGAEILGARKHWAKDVCRSQPQWRTLQVRFGSQAQFAEEDVKPSLSAEKALVEALLSKASAVHTSGGAFRRALDTSGSLFRLLPSRRKRNFGGYIVSGKLGFCQDIGHAYQPSSRRCWQCGHKPASWRMEDSAPARPGERKVLVKRRLTAARSPPSVGAHVRSQTREEELFEAAPGARPVRPTPTAAATQLGDPAEKDAEDGLRCMASGSAPRLGELRGRHRPGDRLRRASCSMGPSWVNLPHGSRKPVSRGRNSPNTSGSRSVGLSRGIFLEVWNSE